MFSRQNLRKFVRAKLQVQTRIIMEGENFRKSFVLVVYISVVNIPK